MSGMLNGFPALARLELGDLAVLESRLSIEELEADEVVVKAGDDSGESRSLFFVLEGNCLVLRDDGPQTLSFPIRAGELFGLVALVDGGARSATVRADGPVRLARLSHDAFMGIRKEGGTLAFELELAIARQLARDFVGMNERLSELAGESETASLEAEPEASYRVQRSYSGLHQALVEEHSPSRLGGALSVLNMAQRHGRRVTLRGAGLSFDTQGIGNDLALNLGRMAGISVDESERTVTVGPGARWGEILAATSARGFVPPVAVSGSGITAAGTAATNSLSRFSPIWGKEGKWIRSVDLLLPSGERVRASRTESPELFYSAIGGFGVGGALLEICHEIVPIGTPIRVESWVGRLGDLDRLAEALMVEPNRAPNAQTSYAVLALAGDAIRSMVTRSRYVTDVPLRPMLPHRPANVSRLPIELAIHNVEGAGQRFWNFAYDRYVDESRPYIDELEGYTFFMDGNVRTHHAAERMGLPFRTIQQTYVIPSQGAGCLLAPFIRRCRDATARESLDLALIDVLHLPADEPFALSSTRGIDGFAITLTFEGIHDVGSTNRLRGVLVELSQEVRKLGGRVHLTKNVFATHDDLNAMYAEGVAHLAGIRRRHDPNGIFGSDFIDRLFPTLRR